MNLHDCGAGVEPYELRRVVEGPLAGQAVFGCPACGWEWLAGFATVVDAASDFVRDERGE